MPIISGIVAAASAAATAIGGAIGTVTAAFSAGGFLASGSVAGFVARAALSIGLSMGLNAFAGQNSRKRGAQAEPAANNQTLQIGGNIPRQVAFGKVGTKGQLSHVWAHGAGSSFLTQIFVLSDGRIGGLTGIWLGDKKLTLRALPTTHGEHQRFDTVEHDAPHFEVRIFDGRDGQVGPHGYMFSLGTVGSEGQADALYAGDRGAGVAYAVVTIWQFNNRWSGIPDWTFEIDGYRCYDPRFDSTVGGSGPMRWEDRETWTTSSNPAVQVYNYLRGIVAEGQIVMGMEVPVFDLQHDLFMQAAAICDETVTLLEGGTETRYVSSLIVTADEGEHRNAIAPIVQAMAGYLVEKVGQFGVIAGAAQVPVVSITDQDLVWTRGARYSGKLSRQSRANEVHGQFVDTKAAWQPNSYAPVKDAGAAANDGERLAQQLDLPAVPSPTQAYRIAKARLRESRRQSSADIELGYHLLWLEIGDWIVWTSAKYGFTKTFRIVGWGRNADDTTAVSLREVGNEIYSHTAADEEPYSPPGTTPGEPALLTTPQGWNVQADVAPDTQRPIVVCSWTPITDARVIAMIIEYRPVGTFDSTRVRDDTPLDGRFIIDQPATGPEYEYRAQLRTEPPRPVFWTSWVRLTVADDVRDKLQTIEEFLDTIGVIEPDSITADMLENAFRLRISDDQLELHNNQLMTTLGVEFALQQQKELQERAAGALRADVALGLNPIGANIDRLDQVVAELQAASATTTTQIYAAIAGVSAEIDIEQSARVTADSAQTTQLNSAVSQLNADIAGVDQKVETLVAGGDLRATDMRTLFVQDVEIADAATMADFLGAVKRGELDDDMKRRVNFAYAGIARVDEATIANGEAIARTSTVLTAEINGAKASVLAESQARTSALEATASQITALNSILATANSNLTTEIQTRAAADVAFAGQLTTLTSNLGATNASLSTEISTRATQTEALSNQFTTLNAALGVTNANVTNEITARVNGDSALAGQISTLTANLATTNASLSSESVARANGDAALAGTLTTVQANADLASAFGQFGMSVLAGQDGAVASYQVRLLAGAYNGGMRIDAMSGGGVRAVFDVGSFLVRHPGVNGGAPFPLFAVAGGGAFLQGPLRVNGDVIVNGAVTTDKVESNAISQTAGASSGGTQTAVGLNVRAGARIAIQAVFNGLPGTYFPQTTPNNFVRIVRAGNIIAQTPTNFEASGTSTPAISFTCTSVLGFDTPPAGYNEWFVQSLNGGGVGGVAILVQELAK